MHRPDEYPALVSGCNCQARWTAMEAGEFIYLEAFPGWVFTEAPLRGPIGGLSSRNFAIARGVEDFSGEPFVWQCCPFCGHDLPMPVREDDATGGFDENTNWR